MSINNILIRGPNHFQLETWMAAGLEIMNKKHSDLRNILRRLLQPNEADDIMLLPERMEQEAIQIPFVTTAEVKKEITNNINPKKVSGTKFKRISETTF